MLEMVAALADELAPPEGVMTPDSVFVWLDIFSIDHTMKKSQAETFLAVEEAQAACSKGERSRAQQAAQVLVACTLACSVHGRRSDETRVCADHGH